MKISISILLIFTGIQFLSGQPCEDFFYDKKCYDKTKEFKIYGQSKNALMEVDSTSSYPIIFYGRKDYIVTVCTEKGYYPIHFKLIDILTGEVLYDNMHDDYYESVGFTVDVTRKINLVVSLLAEDNKPKNFGDTQACIGVNIQWKKSPKIGFIVN